MLDIAGAASSQGSYEPPKVTPLADDAGLLKRLWVALQNPFVGVPAAAYRERVVPANRFGRGVAYISDPDVLEEILVRRWRDFPKSEIDHRVFRPFLGEGLLTAEGDDWRWKRRLAAPTFAPAALEAMAPAMIAPFEALAAEWSAAPNEADVDHAMVFATLKVIERILFRDPSELRLEDLAAATDEILAPMSWVVLGAILKLPQWYPYPGRLSQARARRRVREMVGRVIRRRRASLEAGETPPEDITTSLLLARDPESGRPLSNEDMADMLLTLVGAGHETSAHTLTWTLYCLAHQPSLQDALAEEARSAADGGALSSHALPELAGIEAAVKETLRLFPVAPMMGRTTTRAERLGGFEIPAGVICAIPIYALHRNTLYWERPDAFDIGRFLNQPDPPRTLYMPFGAGPRVCIGARLAMMEMTLGLAALLRRLRFEPCARTACEPLHRVTLRPRDGLILKVSARE